MVGILLCSRKPVHYSQNNIQNPFSYVCLCEVIFLLAMASILPTSHPIHSTMQYLPESSIDTYYDQLTQNSLQHLELFSFLVIFLSSLCYTPTIPHSQYLFYLLSFSTPIHIHYPDLPIICQYSFPHCTYTLHIILLLWFLLSFLYHFYIIYHTLPLTGISHHLNL